ncbi:hypothetical protein BS47DRAFT_1366997 [Hydnum rufescens UP504]|uniref:Uncharacterized protein n=1 Tax=Hydnum rufescens UP504 TaxID=1448309 RepID=A0A9P6AKG0_9AGAM|nr:hypothetical protein BS47DRAFT_1366997 [Hydnum rufescens UP504]
MGHSLAPGVKPTARHWITGKLAPLNFLDVKVFKIFAKSLVCLEFACHEHLYAPETPASIIAGCTARLFLGQADLCDLTRMDGNQCVWIIIWVFVDTLGVGMRHVRFSFVQDTSIKVLLAPSHADKHEFPLLVRSSMASLASCIADQEVNGDSMTNLLDCGSARIPHIVTSAQVINCTCYKTCIDGGSEAGKKKLIPDIKRELLGMLKQPRAETASDIGVAT